MIGAAEMDERESPAIRRKASLAQTARAVFWSFFGVRKRTHYEADAAHLNPIHVVVMGVMIVVGTVTLVVLIAQRLSGGIVSAPTTVQLRELDEPSGTAIAGVTLSAERMVVQLRGGGPDRPPYGHEDEGDDGHGDTDPHRPHPALDEGFLGRGAGRHQ